MMPKKTNKDKLTNWGGLSGIVGCQNVYMFVGGSGMSGQSGTIL